MSTTLPGTCTVKRADSQLEPLLVFVQTWPAGGKLVSHTWRIRAASSEAVLLSESGAQLPQLRR